MNLILLFSADMVPGTSRALLTGRRHAHVLEVHRAVEGDILTVGLENGRIGEGRVTRLTSRELEMEIVWTADPPPRLPVVLAVALMRPPVFRRVLQTAAAMGVLEIHVFQSHRVEKSFWQSSALAAQDVDRQLVLGLEQARDTVMPQVMFHPRFSAFTRDILPGLVDGRTGMVAHPSGPRLQASGFQPPALVLIGPEGGFIDRELAVFQSAGCSLVSLGPRILRVETAVAVLLASFL